jgi:hypothetical protein
MTSTISTGAIVLAIVVASQGSSPGRERTSSKRSGGSSVDDDELVELATCTEKLPEIAALVSQAAMENLQSLIVFYQLVVNYQPILQKFMMTYVDP